MSTIELRPHQNEALAAIKNNERGIINLPTGTGKTLIQSRAIIDDIRSNMGNNGVYVILSPRILLSNQILENVRTDLMKHKIDAQYLVVHSGYGDYNTDVALLRDTGLPYRETTNTTSTHVIKEQYERAHRESVPLIISSTYNSYERIVQAGIPVKTVHCDEAHSIVNEQFEWISRHDVRSYFYTATMKHSSSDSGIGMNNTERFGEVIYQKLPIEMIEAGEIVRPRMHLVDMKDQPKGDEGDALAIIEAFKEHRSLLQFGAKLLVVTKGQEHLNKLVNSEAFARLRRTMPSLKIFDISSDYGARINGQVVKRQEFFKQLREMKDEDNAIILHVDILAEGIDVPGISGIMIFDSLKKSKFLQTLGRATRLNNLDRTRLYKKLITPNQLDEFVKPYSYVIIPVYGSFGVDLETDIRDMITELRGFGFNPSEDIVIKANRGKQVPVPIETTNEISKRIVDMFTFVTTVYHEIEKQEEADELAVKRAEINGDPVKLRNFLIGLK